MRVVRRYEVPLDARSHELKLPVGAELVAVGLQYDEPTGPLGPARHFVAWLLVDPHAKLETRRFTWIGTGGAFPAGTVYRGTVQDGRWVWHLLEDVSDR